MKFLDILSSSSHNLWRNKSRTILTVVAIFIGAFTISLTTAVNTGVNDYIDRQIGIFGTNKKLLEVQKKQDEAANPLGGDQPTEYNPDSSRLEMGGMSLATLNNDDIEKIAKIDGIERIQPYIMASAEYMQGANDKKFVINGRAAYEGMSLDTKAGRAIDIDSPNFEVNIPESYVKSLGFTDDNSAVGQNLKLAVKNNTTGEIVMIDAEIVGVLNKSLLSNQAYFNNSLNTEMNKKQMDGLPENLKNNFITSVAYVKDGYESGEKLDKVKEDLTKAGYTGQTIDDQIGMVRDIINAVTGVLIMFGAIALLAASFGIINTLFMSVQERTREIGLFKAMGLSSGKVFAMFSVEAILIGFWGSVIGYSSAVVVGGLVNNFANETFLKGLDGFHLTMFTPQSAIMVCGTIMLIAFLSGTLPSRRAAKQDPIDALRYE